MLLGFRRFLARGNVVDLAVAVVIGTAFTAVVSSFVADLLTPLIAALFGEPDFSGLTFTVNGSEFRYGSFLNALLAFLIVAAAIYFVVVGPLERLKSRREAGEEPAAKDCPECLSEIPYRARRCPNCTSQLEPQPESA
jgi:large conductance mechanosensitive channel